MKQRDTGLHASTYYLPLIRSHADAMLRLKETKPIKGRTPDMKTMALHTSSIHGGGGRTPCVPLGRRGDIDIYSIREGEGGNIELVNYRTPLMTFTLDNKIIITPKYMGLMESGMVSRVLGVTAWLDRKKIGITIDNERHVIKQNGSLTLKSTSNVFGDKHSLSVLEKEVVYSHYVNRKASNIVRLRYSGFMKYLHGFLQLRKNMERNELRVSMMEIADCIGYEYKERGVWSAGKNQGKTEQVWQPALESVKLIEYKPQDYRCLGLVGTTDNAETLWSAYSRQCNSFMAAIRDDQPEETRTDNYYRMTLTLLALSMPYSHRNPLVGEDMPVDIPVGAVERMLDKVMMQWHSEEMLERRPLKPNQLPNDKYESYITKMPTPKQVEQIQKSNERLIIL